MFWWLTYHPEKWSESQIGSSKLCSKLLGKIKFMFQTTKPEPMFFSVDLATKLGDFVRANVGIHIPDIPAPFC